MVVVPFIKEVVQPPESVVLVESDSESESVLMVVVPLIKEIFRPSEYVVLVESDSKSESASHDVETTQEESADNSPPSKMSYMFVYAKFFPIRKYWGCILDTLSDSNEMFKMTVMVEVVFMLQEPNHCGEEFGWDDEIEDDLVENLVVKTLAQFALPAAATTSLVGVPIYISSWSSTISLHALSSRLFHNP
ncbi:hypothetical protein Bca101_072542 [Brassica carinata]